jgi:hypothetical protein
VSDIIGFVRVILPRYSEAGQRAAMEANSIPPERVLQEGGKQARGDRAGLLRMMAPGRTVAVLHLFLLADPRAKRKRGGTRADLWKVIDKIEASGAVIWELYTGLRSDSGEGRDQMTREAVEALARGRHKTSRSDKRGRPPKQFTSAQVEKARAVWESRKHKTWQEAEKHLPKGMSARDAWKLFGRRDTE